MTFSKLGTDTDTGQIVYLPKASRLQGLYIIGIQGTGKSGLIENLIMQDIDQQIGVCVLDPHGELIDHVIARLPGKAEEDKVIFFDLADYKLPFGLNLLECPDPTDDGEIVKTLYQVLHVFEKAYGIVPTTPLMYDLLYHTVYTLIANPGYTMIDIRLLLTNEACRKKLAANVPNTDIQDFWRIWDDPKQTSQSKQQEDRKTILNKMNDFLHVPLRNIVGQGQTTFDLEDMMNTGKILLVKLSRRLEQPSNLIGSIIIAQLLNAAYARPTHKRKQFHLYADEFQNFATEDFATLLEEARKFGIGTTIAHQNRGQLNAANSQLETDLKDRSRSVGNMVVFKINSKDADELVGEFKITPQAAWEQEVEKESFERVEEEVLDGEEEILVPQQASLRHLLDNGHKNQEINTFINQWLRRVLQNKLINLGLDFHDTRLNSLNYIPIEQLETELNQLIYETMVTQRGDLPIPYNLVWMLATSLSYKNFIADAPKQYVEYLLAAADIQTAVQTYRQVLLDTITNAVYQRGKDALYTELTKHRNKTLVNLYEMRGALHVLGAGDLEQTYNIEYFLYYFPWMHVEPINPQQFQQLQATYEYGLRYDDIDQSTVWYFNSPSRKLWFTQQDIKNLITQKPLFHTITQELTTFETFIIQLRNVLMLLSQEDNWVEVGSGQRQPRKRKQINYHTHPRKTIMHPQRTYQDVQNELETQLVSLPNFSARVKIGVNAPQNPGKKCLSCKLLNNSDALYCTGCGKELPAPNEFILATIKPASGMNTQQLEQRMKRIQARNLQQGYLRDRKTIEAEILQRQTSCSGGSAPVQPQPQQPSPQQPQRFARQVPVQGNCPTCGKSNPTGSKFCNQCGTKLT